jgi:hypothetical protein
MIIVMKVGAVIDDVAFKSHMYMEIEITVVIFLVPKIVNRWCMH